MGRLLLALSGGVAAAALLVHCNTYDASLVEGSAAIATPKNGIGWWSKPDGRGCLSAGRPRPEDRPAAAGDEDIGPILLAVSSMRLGLVNEEGVVDPNAWKDMGFDLDGVCTASDTCPSADPPPSCKSDATQIQLDGKYCRDNTFGRLEYFASLTPALAKTYGLSDDAFNCALCAGQYSILLRITGYNGKPNDDHVRIDVYPSPGLEHPLPLECATPAWKTGLCFSPDLPWTVQRDVLTEPRGGPDLPPSKIVDDQAYVRDGYAVVRIPGDTQFWFPGYKALVTSYPLRIQDGLVVGKLGKGADNAWSVTDGIISGRVRQTDMIEGFKLIGFCESTDKDNFGLLNTFIGNSLDVLADGTSDPARTCDAMSLGVAFTARQATAGKVEAVAPLIECVRPLPGIGPVVPDAGAPTDAGAD